MLRRNSESDREQSWLSESSFAPPFCPSAACATRAGAVFAWKKDGSFGRKNAPRRVQRYRCLCCGRHFSTQTFRDSYWQKRPELDFEVRKTGLVCASNRQIGRLYGCNKETVAHKIARGARQVIRFHARVLANKTAPLTGAVRFDGLWSYEYDPNFRYELNHAIADCDFVLGFSESEMRRSGTLTKAQRRDRAAAEQRFGLPARNATEIAVAELLGAALAHYDFSKTVLWSDEHRAYPRAIRRIGAASIPHKTVSSKAIRDARNPLFPVNLADMLIRHTQSNQKRETIAFSKRRQGGLDRAWLWAAERNYVLPRRIKRGDPPPAVQLGLIGRALTHDDLFARRVFDFEVEIPEVWRRHIRRDVVTRVFPKNRRHRLKYAA